MPRAHECEGAVSARFAHHPGERSLLKLGKHKLSGKIVISLRYIQLSDFIVVSRAQEE